MDVERRTVIQAGGLVAVGGLVAACGSSSSSTTTSAAAATPSAPAATPSASPPASPPPDGDIPSVSDIPVGGGIILETSAIVLTQPTAGDVKAFTAICTHQGCLVSEVVDNEIICPCHGSKFSATDGSVITGPAQQPLASAGITVDGGNVVLS